MNKIKFTVGDWSQDGHNQYRTYFATYEGDIRQLRAACGNVKTKYGFDLRDIMAEYDWPLDNNIRSKLLELGIFQLTEAYIEGCSYEDELDEDSYLYCDDVAMVSVALINLVDPSLNVTLVPEEQMPTIHLGGYGCFS